MATRAKGISVQVRETVNELVHRAAEFQLVHERDTRSPDSFRAGLNWGVARGFLWSAQVLAKDAVRERDRKERIARNRRMQKFARVHS